MTYLECLKTETIILSVVQGLSSEGVGGAHPAVSSSHFRAPEADVDPGGRHDVRLHLGLAVFPPGHLEWRHGLPAGLVEEHEGVRHQVDHLLAAGHHQSVGVGQVTVPALLGDPPVLLDHVGQQPQDGGLSIDHLYLVRLQTEDEVAGLGRRNVRPEGQFGHIGQAGAAGAAAWLPPGVSATHGGLKHFHTYLYQLEVLL